MRIRNAVVLALAAAAAGVAATPAGATLPQPVGVITPATVEPAHQLTSILRSYPVSGRRRGRPASEVWRVTQAGGNCCENYVTATPTGRLVTFGGTYPFYSDDLGRTWSVVRPMTPLNNGEGAIVPGPNGELYGIGWDAYSGDHLQAFAYSPVTRAWSVTELPVHNPFYDRPWITLAKGPFQVPGESSAARYVMLVRGGTLTKDPELLSTNGLAYSQLTSLGIDSAGTDPAPFSIPRVREPLADYWQPHPWANTIPLTGGGLLQIADDSDLATCPLLELRRDTTTWRCVQANLPGVETGAQIRQDSRGWLSDVIGKTDHLEYRLSADGARTWSAPLVLTPPRGKTLEAGNLFATAVSGRLGLAAVSARFDDAAGNGQDMVFRVDISRSPPRLIDVLLLGKGDLNTANDVTGSAGNRFDYASVAILPNGAIAASFDDTTTRQFPQTQFLQLRQGVSDALGRNQPNLAIQQQPYRPARTHRRRHRTRRHCHRHSSGRRHCHRARHRR